MGRLKKVIRTVVVLGAALALVLVFVTWREEQKYQETLLELRALGAATNGAELSAMGEKLGESDGTFEAALEAYRHTPGADEYAMNMRGWVAAEGPSDAKRAREALAAVLPLVQRTARAQRLDTEGWRRKEDSSDGRLYAVKAFAGMMVGESKLASLRGDHGASLAALEAANNISVLVSENPTQFETLLAVACQGLHWSAGIEYLNQFSNDANALDEFDRYLSNRRQIEPVAYALKGELGYIMEGLETPGRVSKAIEEARSQSGLPPKPYDRLSDAVMGIPSVRTAAKRKLASHFRDALRILNDEPKLNEQYHKLRALDREMDAEDSLPGKVANLIWDGFETPMAVHLRTVANGRVLRVAARCLMQQTRSGKLPLRMPDLGNDSVDPFTGQPLLYKLSGHSFKVYSVGQNLVDDGGLKDRLEDIVFEFVPSTSKVAARIR